MRIRLPVISIKLKQLIVSIAVATVAIVCVLFIAIVWVLHLSSTSLDKGQTTGEAKLLHSLVDDYKQSLSRSIADYSAWTELYQYFNSNRKDAAWEKENLGPYITQAFAVDDLFFITRSGRMAYYYPLPAKSSILAHMLRDKRTIVQVANLAFAREISGKEMAVGGFTSLNGIPSLVSAVTVRDSSSKAHSNVALVAVRVLSTSALGALGRNYGITGLRPVMNSDMGIELRTPQGAVSSIRLVWQPARAGRIFFRKTLPIMFAIVILTLLAFMAVAFVAVRILTHAQAQEQRAQQAELDATEIRARAAEETARTKSAFIANMSHELRTPLNAIIGFSDMIRMETFGPVTNEKYRDYLNAINDSGKHLLDLVNDILQFSRIEAGKLSVRMEPLELEPLVRECVRITNGIALERNVRIECNRSGGPPMVLADRQATKQVLLNLLSNAVKFSPPDTAVTIDCRDVDESRHVIRICDQGCGIPAATLREIGKPFVQAEQTYSRKFQGTGLGLAICFLLASVMDAFIDIDSAQGEGTTVSVTFRKPVALNAVQAA